MRSFLSTVQALSRLEHAASRPAEAQACSEARIVDSGTVAQQELHLSTLAVVLALFQVIGASSQSTDEDEDLSLPVSFDTDLMLAVSIICIGVCFIVVWEFLKWCFSSVIVRREAGTVVSSLSPRKARKLQRLRDQTAEAIQAEISAREEAASSQSATVASKRRPSQTTHAEREQAGGAPTRFFALPEGTKLHRTKTCPTLANSHRFSSTKCASSATGAPLTTRSTTQGEPLHPNGSDFRVSSGPVFPAQGTWCRRPDGLDLHREE